MKTTPLSDRNDPACAEGLDAAVEHACWIACYQPPGNIVLRVFGQGKTGLLHVTTRFFHNRDPVLRLRLKRFLKREYLRKHHVFYGVNSFSGKEAKAKDVKLSRIAQVDADKVSLPPPGPQPTRIVETSPGNRQLLYLLDRNVERRDVERVSAHLTALVGGDKGGHSSAKLLRLPGTHNVKPEYQPAHAVRVVERDGPVHDATELLELAQRSSGPKVDQIDRSVSLYHLTPVEASDARAKFMRLVPPDVRLRLRQRQAFGSTTFRISGKQYVLAKDDRSKIIWQIGSALAAAGATPSETLAILKLTAFWRDRAVDGKSEDQERLIAKLFNAAPPPTPAIYANALVAQDPGDWADKPLPVRDFLIDKTFPMRKVTGLYGDGGLGKTTLALQLAIAVATGQPFLEMPTRQGKVFAVLAENEEMDSHISFDALCRSCSIELSDLRGRIKVASRAGLENILMSFPRGQPTLTPLFDELIRQVKAFAPILVIIDTAADVFGGNEISRPEVRAFIADCCGRIARESGAAVLLLLHPSKAGMESGRGDGGSTAWHNSMRGRWYLKPAEDGDVERRVLDLMKAQYGPPGTSLQLRWRDGAFEIDKGGSSRRNTPDETKIIAEVERAFRESEPWSAHHQSQTKWLGRWIITHLNKKRAGANALVNRLLSNGAVVSVEYDRHRHRQGLCTPLQAAEFRRAKQTRKSEATSPK